MQFSTLFLLGLLSTCSLSAKVPYKDTFNHYRISLQKSEDFVKQSLQITKIEGKGGKQEKDSYVAAYLQDARLSRVYQNLPHAEDRDQPLADYNIELQ